MKVTYECLDLGSNVPEDLRYPIPITMVRESAGINGHDLISFAFERDDGGRLPLIISTKALTYVVRDLSGVLGKSAIASSGGDILRQLVPLTIDSFDLGYDADATRFVLSLNCGGVTYAGTVGPKFLAKLRDGIDKALGPSPDGQ